MMSQSADLEAVRSYHHGDLRRAILESTLEIIDKQGLEAVSLRAVARRLGVSEAAPYHHFSGKQELLAVLAADAYRSFGECLTTAVGSAADDPFARLNALARAYIEYGLESRGRYRLMFGNHMVDLGEYEEVQVAGRPTRAILESVIAGCVGSAKVDAAAIENISWSLCHGLTSLIGESEIVFDGGSGDGERLIEVGISILIAGIRAHLGLPAAS